MINIFEENSLLLKWEDDIVGVIHPNNSLSLKQPSYNPIVSAYFKNKRVVGAEGFKSFLSERVFSKDRRDVNSLLARMGLKEYDVFKIARSTRAFSLSDKFWISYSELEQYGPTFIAVFRDLYKHNLNTFGDSIASPSGCNVKQYVFYENEFGIAKQSLHPFSTDAANEVIAYRLSKLFGVNCCSARMLSANTVFSKYEYDFNREFLIHARNVVNGEVLSTDNYDQLISTYFPKLRTEILKMILFDFIILQDDRHMSNWGVLIDSQDGRQMYKLYDNGRSLFHESDAEMVTAALADPIAYSNSFGLVGTYYDAVTDIAKYNNIHELLNLNVTEEMVRACFYGFDKYADWKREGCVAWVMWAINTLKSFGTPTGLTENPYSD